VAALPSVTIGTQVWTNKNLDVTTYRDGTPIPQVTDPTQWLNLTTGAWCYYNNDPANGAIYGKLYNGYAVAGIHDAVSLNDPLQRKQLAPIGWRIPSSSDWVQLVNFAGGVEIAGKKLKSTGKLQDNTGLWAADIFFENQEFFSNGTNEFGFSAIPGGWRKGGDGNFININNNGTFWYYPFDGSIARNLASQADSINFLASNITIGLTVRCIKD
jgi:uncharacterized protein (TIGR02145 family)